MSASLSAKPDGKVVELSNVSVAYKKGWRSESFIALDDVSLQIQAGETVGFIGNNGAGKSTTLRIILGLQSPSRGTVFLNGKTVEDPVSRKGVAYVPESPYLYDYLTPLELLSIGVKMHRLELAKDEVLLRRHCLYWLERFGIAHAASRRIRSFSKGMTQRTALAHALACQPSFLILDEPLSGLDPIGRQEVVAILDEYRGSGGTLFFSSHVLNDVERLADRFIFIDHGKIRAVCSITDVVPTEIARFSVVIEGEGLEGFLPISSRLWQKEIEEPELSGVLSLVGEAKKTKRVALHSIRNVNNLERAYIQFVRDSANGARQS